MRLRMSRRIHGEDFESGRRHARYVHVLFHRNVPRGIEGIYIYIYNTFVSQVRTVRGFILDLVCGPPCLLELLPTISPVPYVNLKICRESRIPPISIAEKTLVLALEKRKLDFYDP